MVDPISSSSTTSMSVTENQSLHAHKRGDAKHSHRKEVSNQW
jgi:hypothetical protein